MSSPVHATISRLMLPGAIAVIAMIAAIITADFYASLILGLGGGILFLYVMTKLFQARKALANERIDLHERKSTPPE